MEKYKRNNVYAWCFSKYEKSELREALSKYGQDRVEDYIDELESLGLWMKLIVERIGNLDRQTYKLDQKRIINRLKKALDELKWLKHHNYMVDCGPSCLDDLTGYSVKDFFDTWSRVEDSIENLEKIIAIIESTKPSGSKIDPNKFVTAIYSLFWKHFEKPTTYEDGPFTLVVRICLNAVGIAIDDVSRHVKAAHKNLS
jgi:hypothetical protein